MSTRRSAAASVLLALPLLALLSAESLAQPADESPIRKAELIVLDAAAGGSVEFGIHVVLEPGWHLYWSNPGDAGIAPAIRWTSLPPGYSAGPLRHPVPKRIVEGGLVTFGHEDEVLLRCVVSPPPDSRPAAFMEAAAVFEWMACLESCFTGEAPLRARLPPSPDDLAEGRRLLERFADRFPRPLSDSGLRVGPWLAVREGSVWRLEADLSGPPAAAVSDFFVQPIEGFVIDNAGVSCSDGRLVVPLTASLGPDAPAPDFAGGVLLIDGTGYEFSAPVAGRVASFDGGRRLRALPRSDPASLHSGKAPSLPYDYRPREEGSCPRQSG